METRLLLLAAPMRAAAPILKGSQKGQKAAASLYLRKRPPLS